MKNDPALREMKGEVSELTARIDALFGEDEEGAEGEESETFEEKKIPFRRNSTK